MSFLLALAAADMALVASTTRHITNTEGWRPGERRAATIVSDGEAFTLPDPLHQRRVTIPASPFRNVQVLGRRPVSGALCVASIPCPPLVTIYEEFGHAACDLRSLDAAFQATAREYMNFDAAYASSIPAGHLLTVVPTPLGFAIAELKAGHEPTFGGSAFGIPPELAGEGDELSPVFLDEVQTPTLAAWAEASTVTERLHVVGRTFVRVRELVGRTDGSVDGKVEVGMIRRVIIGDRWHFEYGYCEPVSAALLRDLPNPEALFEPITAEERCSM